MDIIHSQTFTDKLVQKEKPLHFRGPDVCHFKTLLTDESTNSILIDDSNRASPGNMAVQVAPFNG